MVGTASPEAGLKAPDCHACGSAARLVAPRYREFNTVASDCKPSIDGLEIVVCSRCGHVQKALTARWRAACDAIYGAYDPYHQSGGGEQVIFDAASRAASPRSRCIIEKLQELTLAPEAGKLLDIGCGNGAMLRSFSEVFPRWQLAGSELSDRFRDQVLSIPRVAEFYSGPLAAIETEVDLISMLHVLEHVENPVQALADAARLLRPGGRILIQVPNLVENPFDLLVADHCSHFVPQVLLNVVHRAGLVPVAWSTSWVTKEISVVAGLACDSTADCGDVREPIDVDTNCELVAGHVRWLHDLVERGRSLAKQRAVGIFGTSIAGTWMGAELGAGAKFFVDEDQSRIGGRHLALPIVSVAEVPRDSAVLIVLPPAIASRVQQRVQPGRVDAQFVAPPLLHAA